jgi:ParB-like chromosome segregation protein Spo0J
MGPALTEASVGKKKSDDPAQEPLFQDQPAAGALEEIEALAAQLAAKIDALSLHEKVDALNRARMALHEVSPFCEEPVDLVLWVRNETVDANDYNPNLVAPPEMLLLRHSIEADRYTQPIVTTRKASNGGDPIGESETVDGFHRGRCGKEYPSIRDRVHGYLPITRINADRAGRADRIAATIRHNRARGEHGVERMSDIVRMLYLAGWKDEKIQEELGMQADEVLRLKQSTGLAALFADREFSEAWEPA